VDHRAAAEDLDWMDIGISREHRPWVHPDGYVPSMKQVSVKDSGFNVP